MTVSTLRTIELVPAAMYGRPINLPPPRWPSALPGSNLDCSLDLAPLLADVGSDPIVSASVSIAPSGAGELTCSAVAVAGSVVTAWLSGGVGGRVYTVRALVATAGGLTFDCEACLPVAAVPPFATPPAPPSSDFGTPVVWTPGELTLGTPLPFMATIVAAGTDQSTAAPISAQNSIIVTGIAGGGLVLPASPLQASLRVVNAWTSDARIYPPGTAAVGDFGAGQPIIIAPNQGVTFSSLSPSTQWYAS